MFGGAQRVGRMQQAAGMRLAKQLLEIVDQLLWARLIKEPDQRRVLRGQGDHHAMQADRFGAVHQRLKGQADLQ